MPNIRKIVNYKLLTIYQKGHEFLYLKAYARLDQSKETYYGADRTDIRNAAIR